MRGAKEISLMEISGLRVVNTITYKLPISLNEFIKKEYISGVL